MVAYNNIKLYIPERRVVSNQSNSLFQMLPGYYHHHCHTYLYHVRSCDVCDHTHYSPEYMTVAAAMTSRRNIAFLCSIQLLSPIPYVCISLLLRSIN